MMGPIGILPIELLYEIFKPFHDDLDFITLATLRQVCVQWRQIIDQPCHWRDLRITRPEPAYLLKRHLRAHHAQIQRLTLHHVKDDVLRHVLSSYPALQQLCITQWITLTHHAFRLIATPTTGVQRLEILGGPQRPFLALDGPALVRLLDACPCITHLSIQQCIMPLRSISLLVKALQAHHRRQKHAPYHLTSLTLPIGACTDAEKRLLHQQLPHLMHLHLQQT
ncbi:hypothetical protein BC940DRAFT_111062 [Gongronella butleri]|nr:hypothetical protein BC940DRAFT_111062 [Gongronella butleri]